MDQEKKKIKKRLTIQVDNDLHRIVKSRALFRGMSVRQWVEMAIKERIKEEQQYE